MVLSVPSVSVFERLLDKLWSNQPWKYNIEEKPDIIYMRTLQLSHTDLIQEALGMRTLQLSHTDLIQEALGPKISEEDL